MNDTQELISVVRGILATIAMAAKNYAFYPETHLVRRQSMVKARDDINNFLADYSLRLYIKKDSLFYEGEVVHNDQQSGQTLASPLYRDGFGWLEFHEGLTEEELTKLLNLLNNFKLLNENSDDDLVTAMWEAEFSYIKYQTTDEFWSTEPVVDISSLNVFRPPPRPLNALGAAPEENQAAVAENAQTQAVDELFAQVGEFAGQNMMPAPGGGRSATTGPSEGEADLIGDFWRISLEEQAQLQAMIAAEEHRNHLKDSLEIMLVLIKEGAGRKNNVQLMEFLLQIIRLSLAKGDFKNLKSYVEQLRALDNCGQPDIKFFVQEVQRRLASSEVLETLSQAGAYLNGLSKQTLIELGHFLLSLPFESVNALAPLITKRGHHRLESVIMLVMAIQITHLNANLVPLIGKMPPMAICELLNILKERKLPCPVNLLTGLTRHHAPPVREASARALLEANPGHLRDLFYMIDDPDRDIRRFICNELGRYRIPAHEQLLLAYIKNLHDQKKAVEVEEQVLACYRVLGLCGSTMALPFLKDILLKKGWKTLLGKEDNCHRTGAALALMLMPAEPGSADILQTAAKSMSRHIREAYQEAEKRVNVNHG